MNWQMGSEKYHQIVFAYVSKLFFCEWNNAITFFDVSANTASVNILMYKGLDNVIAVCLTEYISLLWPSYYDNWTVWAIIRTTPASMKEIPLIGLGFITTIYWSRWMFIQTLY